MTTLEKLVKKGEFSKKCHCSESDIYKNLIYKIYTIGYISSALRIPYTELS